MVSGEARKLGETIEDLHPEAVTEVGLVAAVMVDGIPIGHPREGRKVDSLRFLEDRFDESLAQFEDLILAEEGALDVDLGEFRLAVGPEVLVAEAPGNLVVALDAADHEELLEELGALGKGVELPLLRPARDEVVAGPFRGREVEARGLDLEEMMAVEVAPGRLDDGRPLDEAPMHDGSPKVEVAVLHPRILEGVGFVGHDEGRLLGLRDDLDGGGRDLDLAARELLVGDWLPHDLAPHLEEVFVPDVGAMGGIVDPDLAKARAVPEVDEKKPSEVSFIGRPADEDDFLSLVFGAELAAEGGPHLSFVVTQHGDVPLLPLTARRVPRRASLDRFRLVLSSGGP